MPFKLIYLARRNPKIAQEDFSEAWISHSRLASTLINTIGTHFARVRQCIKVYDAKAPLEYGNHHDGAGVMTMKSWDDLMAARYHTDTVTTMRDDEARVFADYAENYTMAAEETSYLDKREGFAALLHFIGRRDDVDPQTFQNYWTGEHIERILGLDIVKRSGCVFALNRVINTPGPDYNFAGISELWFDGTAQAEAAAWDDNHRAAMRGLDVVSDPARTVSLITRINFQKKPGAGL
jgi:EthD domain